MRLNGFRVRQRTPTFVIPAKAGIHALTFRERTSTAIPPPTSTRRPHFVFPAKAHPEPRYGAGIQRAFRRKHTPNPDTVPESNRGLKRVGGANFHTLVCRPQPAWAIGTKMRLNGFRLRERTPQFVIPAKAGIQALTSRERTPTAIPPPTSTQRRRHSAHPRRTPLQAQFARRPKPARAEPKQAPIFVFPAIESLPCTPIRGGNPGEAERQHQ